MMNLPACAAALQEKGITVLLYDPRSIGLSSGEPRNNIDPPQCVSDMSDALSHLLTIPSVKTAQAGVFGMSLGGSIALTMAAVDPRCSFVVAAAPLTDLDFISSAHRIRVLRKCAQDRESQIMGNKAFTVPMVNSRGENAVGFGHGVDKEKYARLVNGGKEIAPGHVNKVTLKTYYNLALWTPWPLWNQLGSGNGDEALRGIALVIPENDTMSYPEAQRRVYDEMPSTASLRKTKIEVEGAGHEDLFADKHLPFIVDNIVSFLDDLSIG
jgi:pimeloyl-ACP methyl ester carboxylesterase